MWRSDLVMSQRWRKALSALWPSGPSVCPVSSNCWIFCKATLTQYRRNSPLERSTDRLSSRLWVLSLKIRMKHSGTPDKHKYIFMFLLTWTLPEQSSEQCRHKAQRQQTARSLAGRRAALPRFVPQDVRHLMIASEQLQNFLNTVLTAQHRIAG